MAISLRVALASIVCVALCGCSHHGSPAEHFSAWQANPVLTGQLGPETAVEGYGLRLPTGYQPMQADTLPFLRPFGVDMHMWSGDKSDPRGRSTFSVIFVQRFNAATPEDVLRQCQSQNRRDLTRFVQSTTERGTINGIPFARTYWSGVETFHSTGRTLLVQGCSYTTTNYAHGVYFEGRNSVDCQGDACRPQAVENTTLPLAEAAVFTFHKDSKVARTRWTAQHALQLTPDGAVFA